MTGYVLFHMWEPLRQSLINGHLFYVDQARKRLLSQFDDIEADADRAADEWLAQKSQNFDPDRHDPADFYEAATDAGIEFYGLLNDMRERTRLSVVAGMYHEWDKQLREWLSREVSHWHSSRGMASKIWSADFGKITDLLESFGWHFRGMTYFGVLEACRLVVNVYKHGDGNSLEALRADFPEYLDDPFKGMGRAFSEVRHRDHSHLRVTDEQVQEFSDAILAFWKDVPEQVFDAQMKGVPDWFGDAFRKDRTNAKQAEKK